MAVSLVVLAVTTVLAVLGAVRTGITTDEPIHVMRLRNFFDTGWYALDWDYGGAGPGGDGTNTFVYAPVTMLLLHGWSVLWGVEGWGEVATTPHAYDVRHLGVVVIGLVGLLAVAAIGRVVLRTGGGVVAAAVLAATPLWTGHEMFNVKDVPVATGYTLATLGLLLLGPRRARRPALRVGRAAAWPPGWCSTLGTRPGMWSGLSVLLVVAVVGVLALPTTRAPPLVALAELVGVVRGAGAALVAIYPNLFGSPLRALPRTSESSSASSPERRRTGLRASARRGGHADAAAGLRAQREVVVFAVLVRVGERPGPARASPWWASRPSRCRWSRSCWARTSTTGCASCSSRSRRSPCWPRTGWRGGASVPRRPPGWSRWRPAPRWCCRWWTR